MRYIPNTPDDRETMMREIGVSSVEDLLKPIPKSLRLSRRLNLPNGLSEQDVVAAMTAMARKNLDSVSCTSFLGAGSYDHYVPTAISDLAGRSEFLTAYTPYQPEVSQGTLQVIYEFQSMICELFRMDAANASLYDGGTALAEAVLLAQGYTRRSRIICLDNVHPHYRSVAVTLGSPLGIRMDGSPHSAGHISATALENALDANTAAVVFQYPNFFGIIEPLEPWIRRVHDAGALAIVIADPIAMGVLEPPGSWGADIVIGEGQALGNPQSYGGPYLGLFAASDKLIRRMPGRIVGVTRDADGRRGYVLTLQTREQHIRRDKATSNICTNEGLCATRAAMFLSLVGPQGLRQIGEGCMQGCGYLRAKLAKVPGVEVLFDGPHFKEFAFRIQADIPSFSKFMADRGLLPGIPLKRFGMGLDDALLVAVTERRTAAELDRYVELTASFLKGAKA
ncbi:MAG: aminomethyl-transferring glycine dehydrogenase subunit GcvPA [bacterium]|nr:aminomethyl-transferring glycine dehydrogenase subunit GcvPA [bacterium]